MAAVLFSDIEVALADYLAAALADRSVTLPVQMEVPNPRPDRFVRLVRVGGTQSNLVTDRPRIVFECWDTLGVGAANLAGLVRALVSAPVPGYVSGVWVDKVIDMGLAFSPDPDTNLPRYLVTAELHVIGAALT